MMRIFVTSVVVALVLAKPPAPDGNPPVTITEEEKETFQAKRLFNVDSHAKTTLMFSTISSSSLALVFVILFIIARPFVPSIYLLRTEVGEEVYKPENWKRNIFSISPEDAFAAGNSLDGCLHILAWTMASRMFLWLVLISPLPCCINWFGAGYPCPDGMRSDVSDSYYLVSGDSAHVYCGPGKDYNGGTLDYFTRLSMTGFQLRNHLAWGHIVTLWLITFIVIGEVRRANAVFTSLRYRWLARRPKALARSVMAVNVTARTDNEFRNVFERCFPGKVVDAKLVKFCGPLSNTCGQLEQLEMIIEDARIAAEKMPLDNDETQLIGSNKLISLMNRLRGYDVREELIRLRQKKIEEQDEVFALCARETEEIENPAIAPMGTGSLSAALSNKVTSLATAAAQTFTENRVFSTVGFVMFTDMRTATQAVQTTYATDSNTWRMSVAPEPSDVLWHHVVSKPRSTNQRLRHLILIGTFSIFLCWSTLIGLFQQSAQAAIETIFYGDKGKIAIIAPLTKTAVLTVCLSLLPMILEWLLISSGRMVKSVVYLEMQSILVLFNIVFVIYVTSVAEPIRQFLQLALEGEFNLDAFCFSNTFGTSVPSQFPTLFTFATQNFFSLSSGLFQLFSYVGIAVNFLILRNAWDHSWVLAQSWSRNDQANFQRFIALTLVVAIGLMIYQVLPLNAVMFLALTSLGSVVYRYRVLYTDIDLLDSGGLFWSQYEIHVLYVLIVVQVTACVVLSSILKMNLMFAICTLPLPVVTFVAVRHLRAVRWEFLPVLHVEDSGEADDEKLEFPYVQPQLIRHSEDDATVFFDVRSDADSVVTRDMMFSRSSKFSHTSFNF